MACTLTVPFWPTSYDNLHWSKDNRLAVLGGEHILFLTPRPKEPTPARLWWDTETLVRINAFTTAEAPRAAVLTDRNTSIGEELSVFHAHAAAWSPSGLAKFGDCGFAVLTTNHVLSVWGAEEAEAKGAPVWTRTIVVNHAIRKFYAGLAKSQPADGGDEYERSEQLQIQQRVRAFAWLQPAYSDREQSFPALFRGAQNLVVATEGGHLLLIHVASPYTDRLTRDSKWSAVVVDSLAVAHATRLPEADGKQVSQSTTALPKPISTDHFGAEHVAVGEWQQDESSGKQFAALVFIVQGRLFSTVLRHGAEAVPSFAPPNSVEWHLHDRADITGPLKVVPGTDAGCVTAFANDFVLCGQLSLNTKKQTLFMDVQSHHFDDRWDDATATTVTRGASGSQCLHIISLLSSTTAPTCALPIPMSADQNAVEEPAWHFALENAKGSYGATYDLGDNVQERTWGIACAPIRGYVAACASMHPNDVVAYIINAEQTSVMNITLEPDTSLDPAELGHNALGIFTGLPASTVLFYLKRNHERRAAENVQSEFDFDGVVNNTRALLSADQFADHIDLDDVSDTLDTLLCKVRIRMFASRDVRHAQATRICDLAAGESVLRAECTMTIIRHLAEAVFAMENTLVQYDTLSMDLKRIYDVALSKLDRTSVLGEKESSARGWSETCQICGQSIAFESFRWARCQQGHRFERCALALLAIQEPGITKQCSVCNLQYLDAKVIAADMPASHDMQMNDAPEGEVSLSDPVNDESAETSRGGAAIAQSTTTLVSLLFAACNVCVYCGGRFKD